ncbi:FlgO family outer membrane protein [uncultured Paraglaciecola sp.]|uniref:FlgO family outer membrane protein n=1 Tax=uncultured Paraglaciecola sp. TaxID=1765024 RepID=UPI00260E2479|nr:FlgO family outer membrane protein [uncultured Paraglaciecola sp.]
MKSLIVGLFISSIICGCSNTDLVREDRQTQSQPIVIAVNTDEMSPYQASTLFQNQYKHQITHSNNKLNSNISRKNVNINHYVRDIMQDLVSNMRGVSNTSPIVVSSFVVLDDDLSSSGTLGNQIAESFIHEIHKFGIPAIDFKTTDYIRITKSGDFVLSRDYLELTTQIAAEYVLLGTLTKQQGGTLVNARIVAFKTKAVMASAQGFLPSHITNSLMNNSNQGGIKLISE